MKKRTLSLVLAAALLLCLLPASAWAVAQNENDYKCGKAGHVHTASCFIVDEDKCKAIHGSSSTHALGCFKTTCGKDSDPAHEHVEACYDLTKCPAYGKDGYHVHEYTCLTDVDKREMAGPVEMAKFQIVATNPGKNKALKAEHPYVFVKSETYETCVHTYYKMHTDPHEGTGPQLFALANFDGLKVGDSWKPSVKGVVNDRYMTEFIPQKADDYNFALCYCCDTYVNTGNEANPYKKVNLEDSSYFGKEVAQKLRAVMYNGYPYLSVEDLQQKLKAAGVEDWDKIDGSVLLGGTQMAIWKLASSEDERPAELEDFVPYYRNRSKYNAGVTAHNENFSNNTIYYPNADKRIKDVARYLLDLAERNPMPAPAGNTVITGVEVTDLVMTAQGETEAVSFRARLNAPYTSKEGSNITIKAKSGDATASVTATSGDAYDMTLPGYRMGDPIEFELEGTQPLGTDVYFFEARPENGLDERQTVQNMIGWSAGLIPVHDVMAIRDPGTIMLKKVDETGKPMTGVRVRLSYYREDYPQDDLLIGEYDVRADGTLELYMLMAGASYKLEEIEAPQGYSLLKEPVIFTIEGTEEAALRVISGDAYVNAGDLVVVNRPENPPQLPKTGDESSLLLAGMCLIGAIAALCVVRRRRA